MSPTIRDKYKYFHSTVQRVKDRRQKFHFCRLPFDVRPRNVKLNLFIDVMFQEVYSKTQEEDSSTMHALRVDIVEPDVHFSRYR